MASLELLLHKGPSSGNGNNDLAGGLEQLRYTVLSDGIPSNSDGMVSSVFLLSFVVLNQSC